MIRTALNIGALAILVGIGVLIYRQVHAPKTECPLPEGSLIDPQAPPAPVSERRDLDHEQVLVRQAPVPRDEHALERNAARTPAGDFPPADVVDLPGTAAPPAVTDAPATAKRTHQVRSGDSLWKISRDAYGSTQHIHKIAAANKLGLNDVLRVGQVLVLPEIAGSKTTATEHVQVPIAKPAPRDADHEVSAAHAPSPTQPDTQAMPPTLSRTMSRP